MSKERADNIETLSSRLKRLRGLKTRPEDLEEGIVSDRVLYDTPTLSGGTR